jgi:hypothetical protein
LKLWLPKPLRASPNSPFDPRQVSAISAWLRLAASTPTPDEYDSVTDVLNVNPAAQTDDTRRPAADASANALPIMVFDGSDMLVWPVAASNHATGKWEILLWLKPSNVASTQRVFACDTASGASLNRIRVSLNNTGGIDVTVFITNADGRTFSTPASVLTAGAWTFIRIAYDAVGATEADQLRVFIGGASQAMTGANLGAGGTIGALRTATGNNIIGAANDSDTPVTPLLNASQIGPNVFVTNAALTTAQATALQAFERPT